ncbi:zinc finger protein 813-like [Centruroides sculpturatus]|uniref:zinc finger protein 813-like n=1 Tax=Centruroides sculpturatus TaxID=218467 RepID=UPI000C6CF32E|nr:zinc finger protein 813-like [Centruroides sculpturatus]XP_023213079.1 zinc finger protein 813-like [Centruroides sculpturatus]XP_023213080.1 zinc finger protein 813-like [Centruroides sculpturatus]
MILHSDKKPFKCNYNGCKDSFKRKEDLKQHMYALLPDEILSNISPKDPKIISRKCHICTKVFLSPAALKAHMRTHTKERPFSCNVCNGTSITKSNLNRHMRKIHSKKETPSCFEKSTQDVQQQQKESFEQPINKFSNTRVNRI